MGTDVWLAITSGLLTLVGTLGSFAFIDIRARIKKLEHQDSKLSAAILTLLVAKSDDPEAIARAIHGLLTNGVEVA